jgi:ATP-dependent RNA helicase DeaD
VVFIDKLRATLKSGDFKKQDHIIERLLEEGFSSTDIASALMHQLQGGEGAPAAKKVVREREPEREVREARPRPAMLRDREESRERPRFVSREDGPPRTPWNKDRPARPRPAMLPTPPVKPREVVRVAEPTAKPAPAVVPEPTREPGSHVVSPRPSGKLKKSRKTPVEQTRLWMNVGEEQGIVPIDVVNAVAGETGLPGKVVGTIDVRERHLFADVSSEHATSIIEKLNRSELKGHKLKVKLA